MGTRSTERANHAKLREPSLSSIAWHQLLGAIRHSARALLAARRPSDFSVTAMTSAMAAGRYIDAHEASWRNAKHGQQWRNTSHDLRAGNRIERFDSSIDVDAIPIQIRLIESVGHTYTFSLPSGGRLRAQQSTRVGMEASTVRGGRHAGRPSR